jgi:threonine synthase
MHSNLSLIEKYRDYLPVTKNTPFVTLGEGNTPLVRALNMPQQLGFPNLNLFFKLEGLNPTGSFKDRGMTLAISKALEAKASAVVCASTGNTSASAAAFATKAGLKCYVVLPGGQVALGKVAQAVLYGAKLMLIDGNFDCALNLVKELAEQCNLTIVNSINPHRLEGQKTAALEVVEQLGQAPDFLFIPVGNAGNISAYWRGFKLAKDLKLCKATPRMFGFEAQGSAAIVKGHPIDNPETIATAIRIGNPASWKEAVNAANESDGKIDCVSDAEILEAYQLAARTEGIFCEPSSAASIAGLIKYLDNGTVAETSTVTCVLTGNGLKDPETPLKLGPKKLETLEPSLSKLREAMSL